MGDPVHCSGHCARKGRARRGDVSRRPGCHGRRRAGGLGAHRRVPVLHDVPDHGEDRLRRGPEGRPQRQARPPDPVCELGRQAVHHVRDCAAVPGHGVPRPDRPRCGGSREDAAGSRPARRRDARGRDGRSCRRRQDAGGPPVAELHGGVHPARHRAVHGHGAGVGPPGPEQRRPHAGHGGDQLADDAPAVRSAGRVPAGRGPVAGAVAGAGALDRHLCGPAAGRRVRVPEMDHRGQGRNVVQ